jgi:hypothetical protein
MLTTYSLYNLSTGEFVSSRPFDQPPQAEPGFASVEGSYGPEAFYVFNGVVTAYTPEQALLKATPPPKPLHTWDNTTLSWRDDRALEQCKRWKLVQMRRKARELDAADITVGVHIVPMDAESRSTLFQKAHIAYLAATDGLTFSMEWEKADGSYVALNANQTKALVRAVDARADTIRASLRSVKALIAATTTNAEADAIIWS